MWNFLSALLILLVVDSCSGPLPLYSDAIKTPTPKGFVIVGDTQRTLPAEMHLFFREQNDPERKTLMDDILKQSPDLLVMMGDLISDGSSHSEWKRFDELLSGFRSADTTVLPAVGNHEYFGDDRLAMSHLHSRFPQLAQKHWYSRVYGSTGMIWLDSNKANLTAYEWSEERAWYKSQLAQWQGDAAVLRILVFTHHPPFTNSTLTGDETDVQNGFNAEFLATPKAIAFISGHAHTYEHFFINNKTFLVSGGGGGPRVSLLQGAKQRHSDLFLGDSPRPFHYLKVLPATHGIEITVIGLDKGGSQTKVLETFTLADP